MAESLIDKLDNLVINNDILPVKVPKELLRLGKKDEPTKCPGVFGIAAELLGISPLVFQLSDMVGLRIQVGHKKNPELSDRVVIKVDEEPQSRWVGRIVNSPGKSGFHPQKFDEGKQKVPGAFMIDRWRKEPVSILTDERRDVLHSGVYKSEYPKDRNSTYRVYNN